jgi:hypothetical protein
MPIDFDQSSSSQHQNPSPKASREITACKIPSELGIVCGTGGTEGTAQDQQVRGPGTAYRGPVSVEGDRLHRFHRRRISVVGLGGRAHSVAFRGIVLVTVARTHDTGLNRTGTEAGVESLRRANAGPCRRDVAAVVWWP